MLSQTYKSFVTVSVLLCAFAFVSNAAKVVSIALCQDVPEEGGPVAATETFSADRTQIQALVTVEEAENGVGLINNWEGDKLKGPGNTLGAKAYVGYANNCFTTLVGIGPKELTQARQQELNQVYASMGTGGAQGLVSSGAAPLYESPQSNGDGNITNPTIQNPDFNGTYTLINQNATQTIIMNQNAQGVITGSLSSTTGVQFQLNGLVEGGAAVGMCTGADSAVYFGAQLQGNQLMFSFINVGVNNMPDYNDTRQVTFTKIQPDPDQLPQPMPQPIFPQQGTGQPVPATGTILGDPSWGFLFAAPQGWNGQKTPQNILLTSSNIVGSIVVIPHADTSLQQVQMNMQQGLIEEGVQLSLLTQVTDMGNNTVAADYAGIVNGAQMKARGIGTFNPNGGGAYIIALASPEQYSPQLASAADSIATNMQYSKPQVSSSLVQHFVGHWWSYSNGAYQTVYLFPDGSYSDTYEYSVSAQNTDQYGDVTSSGSSASHQQSTGRWTVQGDVNRGVLTTIDGDGAQNIYNYRVHIENGQTYYTEYWFEGQHWKKGPPP